MIINGTLYYKDVITIEDKFEGFDTSKTGAAFDPDVADSIAFALYGKTVFNEITKLSKGVPLIDLEIECGGKKTRVVRQPRYVAMESYGAGRPSPEQWNIQDGTPKLQTLTGDEFFKRVKDCIDMDYEEFAAFCKG